MTIILDCDINSVCLIGQSTVSQCPCNIANHSTRTCDGKSPMQLPALRGGQRDIDISPKVVILDVVFIGSLCVCSRGTLTQLPAQRFLGYSVARTHVLPLCIKETNVSL